MVIDDFKERLGRALQILKADLLNGHDFSSSAELIARWFDMDGYEHHAFRRVAIELGLGKLQLPVPPRIKLRVR